MGTDHQSVQSVAGTVIIIIILLLYTMDDFTKRQKVAAKTKLFMPTSKTKVELRSLLSTNVT